jgi:hypothetical protein
MSEHDRRTRPHVDESESKENCIETKKEHGSVESNAGIPTKIVENPINQPSGNK